MRISITADTKEFEKKIASFKNDMPKIAKKLMAYVFTKMRQDIRKGLKANFKRRKGWLLRSITYYAFNDFSGSIFSRNSKKQPVKYASVLENGAIITPKKGKYLYIYGGKNDKGKTILYKKERVTIPPRPVWGPVANDYWGGGGFKAARLMDEGLQKEINKHIEKKGGGLKVNETEGQ
jgi:hypothetical protein